MAAKTFSEILKGNPYHDERGRFTTGPKAKNPMIRTDPPPKKTKIAYKVFLAKDGKLYPPMVANPDGMDTPVGVWLDASEGKLATDKNGNPITNTLGRKKVKSGGKGTQGGSGTLAYRPGWHLGELPEAKQFYTKDKETGEKKQKKNFVWAECEIAADLNYQEEAMSYGYNKNGKFQHSLAGLPKIPKDGYYTYRTNPDPSTQPWYITGSMKVNRILTDRETNAILRSHGIEPMKRDGGELNLKALGFTETNFNKSANGDEAFSIFKTDDDKRLVFGWASVSITVDGEQLEDRQKDIIDPEDLEEAAYEYVLNFRDTGEEHISSMRKKGKLVESCVFTAEKQKAIGIPEGILPIGWWIGFKIEDDAAWQRVKNGTYKMFSIEGKANREPVEKSQPKGCGVLVVQDGKILTGTRIERGGRGKICGPGGHIEAGETPEEAAKREAMEEFGVTCEELTPLGTLGDGSSAIFLCTEFSGTPETDEEEMTEPEWRTIEELGELELFGPFEASLEKLSPAKRHSVAKTFSEVLKFNPYHDERGRFATANGYATFTIQTKDPKKQHWADMAMARMKQQAAANPPAPPKPAAPPKPQKNYDARGFADSDDADFHQLHSGRKYYAQQQLTTTEQNAAANYLSANPEAGSLYSHCQNMNYKMATGQTLTGQYKKTHDGMMSAMHNMGYNVELTRYDHAGMVNGLLKTLGAGTDYERMSQSSLKKALVGQTLSENKFLSASYNDFKNAPNASVFTSRAVKINYKVKANAQAMMPGKGPGGDFGEIVLAPTNGKVNQPGKITDVRLTGQMMRRQGTQTYNQPRIEIDIEIG